MRMLFGWLLACALAVPAHAQSTANELLSQCEIFLNAYETTGRETFQLRGNDHRAWQCFGYMSAAQAFAYLRIDGKGTLPDVCLPNAVQVAQLIRVLVAYAHQLTRLQHSWC
jgi:hypothetical protein